MHPNDSDPNMETPAAPDGADRDWEILRLRARSFEGSLILALKATAKDATRWSAQEDDDEGRFRLIIPPDEAADRSPEWRLGWLATLVETISFVYGIGIGPQGHVEILSDLDSPASLVHGLRDRAVADGSRRDRASATTGSPEIPDDAEPQAEAGDAVAQPSGEPMNALRPQLPRAQAEALRSRADDLITHEGDLYADDLSSLVGGFPDAWLAAAVSAGYVPAPGEIDLGLEASHLLTLGGVRAHRSPHEVTTTVAWYREMQRRLGHYVREIEQEHTATKAARDPHVRQAASESGLAQRFDSTEVHQEALALLEAEVWGEVEADVEVLEHALERLLEATTDDFLMWEEQGAGEARYGDEFMVTSEQVALMSSDWRIAYVARLLRSMAMAYGATTEFGRGPLGAVAGGRSLADLLHKLLDLGIDRRVRPDAT